MRIRVGEFLPGGQFFGREGLEESVVERNAAPQSAEPPLASAPQGNEPGDRLAFAGDHDFFAALDFGEQSEEVGTLPGDVDDNWHE